MTEDPKEERDGEQGPGEDLVQPQSPWAAAPTAPPAGVDETGPTARPTEDTTPLQPAAGSWQPQQPPASAGWEQPAQQPTGPQPPPAGQWGQPAAGTSMPGYPSQPERPRGRGRAFVGIAVGTVLALAAGAFAVTSFGDDSPSSPEAAVEALFAAVEQRDVLGVLDTMAPGERAVYQPFVEEVVAELTRLEVLSDDVDLGDVSGIELDIEGLELESEELGEGVSVVSVVGGTITSTVDPAEVPVGSFIRDLMEDPENEVDMEVVSETSDLIEGEPVEIVVIDDGGWHVSLHYSIAELARTSADAPVPDFGAGVEPDGADSPEAAVEALVQAAVDLDLRRVISLLPPGEMSALHDYAPLFLDDADAAVAELRSTSDFEISIDALDTEVDQDGDLAKVSITGFAVSGRSDGEDFEAAYDGSCLTGTFEGDEEELCADDADMGIRGAFVESALAASLTVLTVEEDGEWYVTPIRTFMEYGLVLLRALDAEALEDPEAFFGELFGIDPFFGTSTFDEDLTFDEGSGFEGGPDAGCSAFYDDLPADATDEQLAEADAAYESCDDSVAGGDPAAEVECYEVYASLPAEPSEQDVTDADAAFEACVETSGLG